jgi:hypothetical protein
MRFISKLFLLIVFCGYLDTSFAQIPGNYKGIFSGTPWLDDRGNTVSAHGANIIKDNGKFYLFGEAHSDTSNAFVGFNCYSSTDLYSWKFESVALPQQANGRLGPNRVGERPKVLKCPATGGFIMLIHTDTLTYKDPCVGYATSKNITGPYTFQGPILFNGEPIKKWDMGSFQDDDGNGYLLVHSGNIYKLSDDYKSIVEQVAKNVESEGESPAMFKKDGIYYWLASHRTSWERNDNFYYTAKSIYGPWENKGIFAPKNSLTWNSQTSFVLPIIGTKDTTYMFMGDRWSFPKQASAATYVWQPINISGNSISIPTLRQGWLIDTKTGVVSASTDKENFAKAKPAKHINFKGEWENLSVAGIGKVWASDEKDASVSVSFKGTQIHLYGLCDDVGGYASVKLLSKKGDILATSILDFYCKNIVTDLKYGSPVLSKDTYILKISVLGEHGNWSDKRRSIYGSKGNFVKLGNIRVSN